MEFVLDEAPQAIVLVGVVHRLVLQGHGMADRLKFSESNVTGRRLIDLPERLSGTKA